MTRVPGVAGTAQLPSVGGGVGGHRSRLTSGGRHGAGQRDDTERSPGGRRAIPSPPRCGAGGKQPEGGVPVDRRPSQEPAQTGGCGLTDVLTGAAPGAALWFGGRSAARAAVSC